MSLNFTGQGTYQILMSLYYVFAPEEILICNRSELAPIALIPPPPLTLFTALFSATGKELRKGDISLGSIRVNVPLAALSPVPNTAVNIFK